MATNDDLYRSAVRAIGNLHADTSVSKKQTLVNLKSLMDEIEIMISALVDAPDIYEKYDNPNDDEGDK